MLQDITRILQGSLAERKREINGRDPWMNGGGGETGRKRVGCLGDG